MISFSPDFFLSQCDLYALRNQFLYLVELNYILVVITVFRLEWVAIDRKGIDWVGIYRWDFIGWEISNE